MASKGVDMKTLRKVSLSICLPLVMLLSGIFLLTGPSFLQLANHTSSASTPSVQVRITLNQPENYPAITVTSTPSGADPIVSRYEEDCTICDGGIECENCATFNSYFTGRLVEKGTTVVVAAASNALFTFQNFLVGGLPATTIPGSEVIVNGDRLILVIQDTPRAVTVNFTPVPFSVPIQGLNQDNYGSVSLGNITTTVTNPAGVTVGAGQIVADGTLRIAFENRSDANLKSFSIRKRDDLIKNPNESYTDFGMNSPEVTETATHTIFEKILDVPFLRGHHSRNPNSISVVLFFTDLFELNVNVNGVGDYEVRRKNESQPTNDRYFAFDEELVLTAKNVPGSFYSFTGHPGLSSSVMARDIKITSNVTVGLDFRADIIRIKASSSKKYSHSHTTATVGQTIDVAYDLSSSRRIKEWKIGGKKYSAYGNSGDIKRSGSTLIITLSPELLSHSNLWKDGELVLNNKVKDTLKGPIMFLIFCAAVLVPGLVGLAAYLFLKDMKRKKFIAAQLTDKRREGIKRDVGGYISNLRDGTDKGEITKADVKQAIRDEKDAKKHGGVVQSSTPPPTSHATPPPPPPAQPAAPAQSSYTPPPSPQPSASPQPQTPTSTFGMGSQQIAEYLHGSSLKPDMSIVKNGTVIATMTRERTVMDRAGKVFATARLQDGAFVDKDGIVVGRITGTGTIEKPS